MKPKYRPPESGYAVTKFTRDSRFLLNPSNPGQQQMFMYYVAAAAVRAKVDINHHLLLPHGYHIVLSEKPDSTTVSDFMYLLNHGLALAVKRELNRPGKIWEGGYYSERLISQEATIEAIARGQCLPVELGLVKNPHDYRYPMSQIGELGGPGLWNGQTVFQRIHASNRSRWPEFVEANLEIPRILEGLSLETYRQEVHRATQRRLRHIRRARQEAGLHQYSGLQGIHQAQITDTLEAQVPTIPEMTWLDIRVHVGDCEALQQNREAVLLEDRRFHKRYRSRFYDLRHRNDGQSLIYLQNNAEDVAEDAAEDTSTEFSEEQNDATNDQVSQQGDDQSNGEGSEQSSPDQQPAQSDELIEGSNQAGNEENNGELTVQANPNAAQNAVQSNELNTGSSQAGSEENIGELTAQANPNEATELPLNLATQALEELNSGQNPDEPFEEACEEPLAPIIFPYGTYFLRRFYHFQVEEYPP